MQHSKLKDEIQTKLIQLNPKFQQQIKHMSLNEITKQYFDEQLKEFVRQSKDIETNEKQFLNWIKLNEHIKEIFFLYYAFLGCCYEKNPKQRDFHQAMLIEEVLSVPILSPNITLAILNRLHEKQQPLYPSNLNKLNNIQYIFSSQQMQWLQSNKCDKYNWQTYIEQMLKMIKFDCDLNIKQNQYASVTKMMHNVIHNFIDVINNLKLDKSEQTWIKEQFLLTLSYVAKQISVASLHQSLYSLFVKENKVILNNRQMIHAFLHVLFEDETTVSFIYDTIQLKHQYPSANKKEIIIHFFNEQILKTRNKIIHQIQENDKEINNIK